jgi:hypothetical protein
MSTIWQQPHQRCSCGCYRADGRKRGIRGTGASLTFCAFSRVSTPVSLAPTAVKSPSSRHCLSAAKSSSGSTLGGIRAYENTSTFLPPRSDSAFLISLRTNSTMFLRDAYQSCTQRRSNQNPSPMKLVRDLLADRVHALVMSTLENDCDLVLVLGVLRRLSTDV